VRLRTILIMVAILITLGAAFYFFSSRPDPTPPAQPRPSVWQVEMDELKTISISLPRAGKTESWVKHEDRYWYFDEPDGPEVNTKRWGGGIPLLLSGPKANRLIAENDTDERMMVYGLADPQMRIQLSLENGESIDIEVGDVTPDGGAYYIRLSDSRDVYTVDHTWYRVLERLVLEPPYPEPEER